MIVNKLFENSLFIKTVCESKRFQNKLIIGMNVQYYIIIVSWSTKETGVPFTTVSNGFIPLRRINCI